MTIWFDLAITERLALALAHFLWQGIAIAATVVLFARLFAIRSPKPRYGLYLAGLTLMAASPPLTFCYLAMPPASWHSRPARAPELPPAIAPAPLVKAPASPPLNSTPAAQQELTPTPSIVLEKSWWQHAQPWIVAAWFAGVTLLSLRLLAGWVWLQRLKRGVLPLPETLQAHAARLAAALGMRLPRIHISPRVPEALAMGLLRPMILLPAAWLTELPTDMLEAILAHELAHLRRLDLWVNVMQRIVETLLFYHPAIWWLSRRVREERELCCDELAVKVTGDRLRYVQTLEWVGRRGLVARKPSLTLAIGGKKMNLLRRVKHLLTNPSSHSTNRLWRAGLLSLLLVAGIWRCVFHTAFPIVAGQAKQPETPYVQTLPSGITVELVGVSEHPSSANTWWTPEGVRLAEAPIVKDGKFGGTVNPRKDAEIGREFGIRVKGLPEPDVSLEWKIDGSIAAAGGWIHSNMVAKKGFEHANINIAVSFLSNTAKTTVQCGFASGPWTVLQSCTEKGGESVGADHYGIVFGEPYEKDGTAMITVAHNINDRDIRLVAIGKDDSVTFSPGYQERMGANKVYQITASFLKTSLADIKGFQFQTRPYEWVEFKGVALRPVGPAKETGKVEAGNAPQVAMKENAEKPATVTGTIVDADGKAIPNMEIDVFDSGKKIDPPLRSDAQGRFQIPKAWREQDRERKLLIVRKDDNLGWFSLGDNGLPKQNADLSLQITLLPLNQTVRCVYTDEPGKALADIPVQVEYLSNASNGRILASPLYFGGKALIPDGKTDQQGRVTFNVPQGTEIHVRANHPDWLGARGWVRPEQTNETTFQLSRGASIAGKVVDAATSQPMIGVVVGAQAYHHDLATGGWGDSVTDEQGRYQINGLSPGQYNVLFVSAARKELVAPAVEGVSVQLGKPGEANLRAFVGRRVQGKVIDSESLKPVVNCFIGSYGPARPNSGGACFATDSDAEGKFQFYVAPGPNRFYVGDSNREHVIETVKTIDVTADRDPEMVVLKAGPLIKKDATTITKTYSADQSKTAAENLDYRVTINLSPPAGQTVKRVIYRSKNMTWWQSGNIATTTLSGDIFKDHKMLFHIDADGFAPAQTPEFTVTKKIDPITVELKPAVYVPITGKVIDAQGKPVAGSRVRVGQADYNEFPRGVETMTDGDGKYTIKHLRQGDRFYLRVDKEGFADGQTEPQLLEKADAVVMPDIVVGVVGKAGTGQVLEKPSNENQPATPVRALWNPFDISNILKSESTDESIAKLADYNDATLIKTSYDPFGLNGNRVSFLSHNTLVPRLGRVKKLLVVGTSNRDVVIPKLENAFGSAISGYDEALAAEREVITKSDGAYSSYEPSLAERKNVISAASAYLLSELKSYRSLPLLLKALDSKEHLPLSRAYLFYAMHSMLETHPRAGLSKEALLALDDYLKAAKSLPRESATDDLDVVLSRSLRDRPLPDESRGKTHYYPADMSKLEAISSNGETSTKAELDECIAKLRVFIRQAY